MASNGFNKVVALGLITVPVKLQAGPRTKSVSLNGLHKRCFEDPEITTDCTLNQLMKCKACGEIVPKEDQLRGYKLDGRHIPLTDEELKAQVAMKDDVLTVRALIPTNEVERLRLDKSQYMGPQEPVKTHKGALVFTAQHRTFEMFRSSLANADRVAVVTYADKGHEKLGVIYPLPVGCLLYESFFDNEMPEILSQFKPNTFTVPTLTAKESGLGAILLQNYFEDSFDWSVYADEYVARVHALAVAKAEGLPIVIPESAPDLPETNDLEAALEAALAAAQVSKPPQPMPAKPKAGKKEQAA
jgi:DNA end-binding protein Ku